MKMLKKTRERISSDALAEKIAGNIMAKQQRIAGYMNKKVAPFSVRSMRLALIVFCLLFGSYCLYLLIHAMN